MIDTATGWFKMAQIPNKTAAEIAYITKKTWFTRYPLSQRIVFDRGTKFMGLFPITQINDNGTVRFQKGIINYATNIRRIKPFFD